MADWKMRWNNTRSLHTTTDAQMQLFKQTRWPHVSICCGYKPKSLTLRSAVDSVHALQVLPSNWLLRYSVFILIIISSLFIYLILSGVLSPLLLIYFYSCCLEHSHFVFPYLFSCASVSWQDRRHYKLNANANRIERVPISKKTPHSPLCVLTQLTLMSVRWKMDFFTCWVFNCQSLYPCALSHPSGPYPIAELSLLLHCSSPYITRRWENAFILLIVQRDFSLCGDTLIKTRTR